MGIRYAVDEQFFDHWNSDMAYTLGFWFADGSIENAPSMRGKYIRVGCTDSEIIQSIKNAMQSQHTLVETRRPGKKNYYLLRIGNAYLFTALKKRGVTERKSLTTTLPEIPTAYLRDFIRGYFDGDGCVYIEKHKDGTHKRLSTIFTSGSKRFLLQLQSVLHQHANMSPNLKISKTRGGFSTAFQLRYSTGDSKKLYDFMYSPKSAEIFLARKKDKFEIYLS